MQPSASTHATPTEHVINYRDLHRFIGSVGASPGCCPRKGSKYGLCHAPDSARRGGAAWQWWEAARCQDGDWRWGAVHCCRSGGAGNSARCVARPHQQGARDLPEPRKGVYAYVCVCVCVCLMRERSLGWLGAPGQQVHAKKPGPDTQPGWICRCRSRPARGRRRRRGGQHQHAPGRAGRAAPTRSRARALARSSSRQQCPRNQQRGMPPPLTNVPLLCPPTPAAHAALQTTGCTGVCHPGEGAATLLLPTPHRTCLARSSAAPQLQICACKYAHPRQARRARPRRAPPPRRLLQAPLCLGRPQRRADPLEAVVVGGSDKRLGGGVVVGLRHLCPHQDVGQDLALVVRSQLGVHPALPGQDLLGGVVGGRKGARMLVWGRAVGVASRPLPATVPRTPAPRECASLLRFAPAPRPLGATARILG